MVHRPRFTPVLVLLLASACAPPGEPEPRAALADVVRAELNRTFTPGAVVAVVVGDTLALLEAYGRAGIADSTPLDPHALFHVGGATPAVNALIAATLAARGEVELDGPVGDYIPSLPEPLRAPTITQLLTHTGGLVAVPALAGHAGEATLAEVVANLSRHDRLTEPGAIHSYAPIGIALAARAMERATGRSYHELAAETVFRPLGLVRATLGTPGPDAAATGHRPSMRADAPLDPVAVRIDTVARIPVAGLFATAADLANLVRAYVTGGTVGGERRLPDDVVATALAPRVRPFEAGPTITLGPDLYAGDPPEIHMGDVGAGHAALIRIRPRERIGVIVLANNAAGNLWRVPAFVFDRLGAGDGGTAPRPAAADPAAADAFPELATGVTRVRLPADTLAGEYWNGGEGLELMAESGLRLRSGTLVLDVEWHDDGYHAVIPDGRTALVFQVLRDGAGRLYIWLERRRIALARDAPDQDP